MEVNVEETLPVKLRKRYANTEQWEVNIKKTLSLVDSVQAFRLALTWLGTLLPEIKQAYYI